MVCSSAPFSASPEAFAVQQHVSTILEKNKSNTFFSFQQRLGYLLVSYRNLDVSQAVLLLSRHVWKLCGCWHWMSADFSGEFVHVLNGEDDFYTPEACRKWSPGFQVKAFLINLRGRVAFSML